VYCTYLYAKSFLSHKAHSAALISVSFALSQFSLQDHRYGASASPNVPVYVPAFAGTHCAYPQSDGQANLTWVAGYMPSIYFVDATDDHLRQTAILHILAFA